MVPKMENTKKKISSKKNTKKALVKSTTKRKLLIAGIIAFVVIVCGGYMVVQTGLPARVLTGATVAGESVKVNEINYHFVEVYKMYSQYGIVSSKKDLTKIWDTTTGQTYGEYLYDSAVKNQLNIILLNKEAKKAGFTAAAATRKVDEYIQSLRDYAKQQNTTADTVLKKQYGAGMSVRDLEAFMTRELIAQEYSEYLKQTNYALTEEQMKATYEAAPADYDSVTYNAYLVPAGYEITATAAQIATAVTAAKDKAQAIIDATTDIKTFRDASATAAGTEGASSFADNADPTHYTTTKVTTASTFNSDVADYLFSADRKEGDKTVITTDSGAIAVYFQTRQLDTSATVSYRSLLLSGTDIAKLKTTAEGYQASVKDEASFITLVKKYSADSASSIAGGLTSNATAKSLVKDSPTAQDTALSDWLLSADRKAGDMLIIENADGVVLYYFQKSVPAWEATLLTSNVNTAYNAWYTALAAESGNEYKINMGAIEFATY